MATGTINHNVTHISNSTSGNTITNQITAGNNYSIVHDGYYLLSCKNTGSADKSATIYLNDTPLISNSGSNAIQVLVPLKAGTTLTTRANETNTNFTYVIVSRFS